MVYRIILRVPVSGFGRGLLTPPYVPVPDTEFIRSLEKVSMRNNPRKRWRDQSGKLYEWDSLHGEVEVYTPRGRHAGVMDADGNLIKDAVRGRKIDV